MSEATTTIEAAETLVCTVCLNELPLESFHLREAGGSIRDSRCRQCSASARRERRRRKRLAGIRKFATAIAADETDDKKLIRLSMTALAKYGGAAKLGRDLAEQAQLAMKERPGSPTACRILLALFRLVGVADDRRRALATTNRPVKKNLDAMDDDELQAELLEILAAAAGGADDC